MKNLLTLFIALLISFSSLAQQGINYKAILKDTNGNLLAGTFMNVQFTIHETTETGTIVYQEDHNYTTDANGLLIHNIGSEPTPSIGVFADIDWGADKHFLQVTIAYSGGTVNFDATEFMAVPYALSSADNLWQLNGANAVSIAEKVGVGTNTPTQLLSLKDMNNASLKLETDTFTDTTSVRFENGPKNQPFVHYRIESTNDSLKIKTEQSFSPTLGVYDLLKISHSGSIIAPKLDINEITGNAKSLVTKEYTDGVATGLEQLSENSNTGWRLAGRDPNNHGAIGEGAVDLSYNPFEFDYGATGDYSTAIGFMTRAQSYAEIAIGQLNTAYTTSSTTEWIGSDRLFVIGNGPYFGVSRSDALIVLKNGTITAPSFSTGEINSAGSKALVTKEYVDANYLSNTSNLIPIAYGIVESNGNILANTGNFIASESSGVFTIDVNDTESLNYINTVSVITPITSLARTSSTLIADGNADGDSDLIVRIFNASGSLVATTFQFVIYKL